MEAVRRGRAVESLRVHVIQDAKEVMDATVCAVAEVEGLEHEVVTPPDVAPPEHLPTLAEMFAAQGAPPEVGFWGNFDARPTHFRTEWPPAEPEDPVWRQWLRFVPSSTFAGDPWLDAARYVLLGDLPSWPSTVPQHAWRRKDRPQQWIAPTLDLYVAFHRAVPDEPWLLVDGAAPVAADGLLGWHHRLWSRDGRLVASGGGQGLFRPTSPPS